jgi:hypothetical protein
MKAKLSILAFLLIGFLSGFSQQNVWDVAATEVMIAHNKKNFEDHEEVRNNQIVSQGTVAGWKNTTNQFKTFSDFIDKRLTSAFIVVADVTTIYNVYSQLSEMMEYEKKSMQIAYRHPWTAPFMASAQAQIIKSGNDLFNYLSLLVISYGDLSKMKVASRKKIFHEIDLQVSVLKARCYSMYNMMQRLDLTTEIKNSKPGGMINKDAQLIKDILNHFK